MKCGQWEADWRAEARRSGVMWATSGGLCRKVGVRYASVHPKMRTMQMLGVKVSVCVRVHSRLFLLIQLPLGQPCLSRITAEDVMTMVQGHDGGWFVSKPYLFNIRDNILIQKIIMVRF